MYIKVMALSGQAPDFGGFSAAIMEVSYIASNVNLLPGDETGSMAMEVEGPESISEEDQLRELSVLANENNLMLFRGQPKMRIVYQPYLPPDVTE